jgi:hypothetical protein
MPLWLVYHPVGTFEDDDSKRGLAEDVTKIYTGVGLPAFYVVMNFIKLPSNDIWVGGKKERDRPFIRISVDHIAVHLSGDKAAYRRVATSIDAAIKPHIADKGYDWEFHVDETERALWRVNGIDPPPHKSEMEKTWAKENRAVPFEDAGN